MSSLTRCVAVLGLVCSSGTAIADEGDTGKRRLVSIEVVIAETGEKGARAEGLDPAAAEKQIARIRELEAQGKLTGLTRVRLSTLEESIATVHVGEKSPYVVNQGTIDPQIRRGSGPGPGAASVVYNWQETGTVVSATPRVEDEGTILIELQVEKSIAPRDVPKTAAEPEKPTLPGRFATLRANSTVRVPNGQTVIVQGLEIFSEKETSQTTILVTARVEQVAKGAGSKSVSTRNDYEIKIFALKSASAASAATIVSSIFDGRPVKIAIDERTNSLILQGPRREFEAIEAILLRLDDAPAPADKRVK